ncbi:zinc finger BED domain-containing protein RICESLEEPER 2-like [Benincasa hispida]|uniref:zinc finger BED domain-containing protein RICESLEEPER 2-like n=1 Tax=Benincasa hispida TaxID=102211 RepID=UPI0019014469|nr:zinc finger BED domain-containing protein RICESLEEPER 2-like [Benincasa hispida]
MFTIESTRKLLVEMIIIDELPFKFVENQGFKRFVNGTLTLVEPNFVLPSRKTIAKDILGIYDITKETLKDIFVKKGYKVPLTTDTWSSIQNMNYLVLITHFIDKVWKLHKRILNFTQIENHREERIGKEVEKYLKQWSIERVMTLTVDNASLNDTAIAYLKKRFKHRLVLDDVVRFVRTSPARLATFKKCIKEGNIDSKSMLCLDVPTRWNSIYLMLEAAVKFEKAFERLKDYDTVYMNEKEKLITSVTGSKVEGVLRALFNEYNLSLSVANKSQSSCTIKNSPFRTTSASASKIFRFDFEDLDEDDLQSVDSEVDIYLLEPRVKREDNFDILDWWKGNSSRYK